MSKHWSGLPYLDTLRPPPGWMVEQATLATYSADLVAMVAALLALAGLDDDRGSGSKVDLANAVEQLRDRVRILVQAGQIGWPAKKIPILAILDRFLREVNQNQGIWHPKLALVKFVPDVQQETIDPATRPSWRLWIGSRNLTRSLDWDTGMLLASDPTGTAIPGIADVGAHLTRLADLDGQEIEQSRRELAHTRWKSPRGVDVRKLRLMIDTAERGLPQPPEGIRKLVAISPFLDGGTVKRLGAWGDAETERVLMSTHAELARLHSQAGRPLSGYGQLLALDAPESEDAGLWLLDSQENDREPLADDQELETRGLHAKLIYAEHKAGRTLWLGSANATAKAWNGPNTEAVAELGVSHNSVSAGLFEFIDMAQTVDPASLSGTEGPDLVDPLDEAHQQVTARWQVRQQRHADGPLLIGKDPPHPDDPGIALEVGLLACDLVPWPRGQLEVHLPPASLAQETELIQVRLRLRDQQRTWVQRAPLEPPPDQKRDRRALSRYLTPRVFLQWVRSLLHAEDIGDGGGDWDTPATRAERQTTVIENSWWAPTLEEMLKAWSRNPANLRAVDHKVQRYLEFVQDRAEDEYEGDEQQLLEQFRQTWQILRQTLMVERG